MLFLGHHGRDIELLKKPLHLIQVWIFQLKEEVNQLPFGKYVLVLQIFRFSTLL